MTKLFICGDIVNYDNHDGIICSDSLAEIIIDADYSVCNFEAPIESAGVPVPKSGPHHYQRKSTIRGLKKQGFDMLCMANNHIMDFGRSGLVATLEEANNQGFDTIGAGLNFNEAYKPLVKIINNIKVGFINACEAQFGVLDYSNENEAGYAWINHSKIDSQILELRKKCDFVIVLSHAGLENYNLPQKEWRQRYKHFCDLGADIIVGSHPHVPQGYERYKDSIIFYSLGNFYFDSNEFANNADSSYSIILDLEKEEKIDFKLVYHYKEDGHVKLSPKEKQIDIKLLNNYLGDDYNSLHDKMSLETYNKKIKKNLLYSLSSFPYDGKVISSIKKIIVILLGNGKKLNRDLISLHLLRNEAYYYATRHALELISNEKYGRR